MRGRTLPNEITQLAPGKSALFPRPHHDVTGTIGSHSGEVLTRIQSARRRGTLKHSSDCGPDSFTGPINTGNRRIPRVDADAGTTTAAPLATFLTRRRLVSIQNAAKCTCQPRGSHLREPLFRFIPGRRPIDSANQSDLKGGDALPAPGKRMTSAIPGAFQPVHGGRDEKPVPLGE